MSVVRCIQVVRHLSRFDRVVYGYALAYMALLLVAPTWPVLSTLMVAMFFPMGGLALVSLGSAARNPLLPLADRRGWRWITAAALIVWLSGMAWTTALGGGHDAFTHSILDGLLDLLSSACLIVGLLQFPSAAPLRWRDRRDVLDVALLFIAWLAMTWHFGLQPLLSDGSVMNRVDLTQLLLTWPEIAVAGWMYLRVGDRFRSRAIAALFGALVISALADFLWFEMQGRYFPGHWVDVPWFFAWLLRWRAGRLATAGAPGVSAPADATDSVVRRGITPTVFVAGAYLSLIVAVVLGRSAGTISLAVTAVAMTALLLVRQSVELRETRELERATVANAARYRALIEHSSDFVLVLDQRLDVRYRSPSAVRIGLVSVTRAFTSSVHPDDQSSVSEWLGAADERRPLRCRLVSDSHGEIEAELRVHDRRDDHRIGGWVINGRDVTAEVGLQRKLRHAQKLAALHDMAGRVAHSYNNSLSTVLGHAELMRAELAVGNPWRDDVEQIHAAATRGAAITRQLLGFSDAHESQPVALKLGVLTRGLVSTLERLLPAAVILEVVLPEEDPVVVVDRSHMEQVIVNLVTNARDAMPTGGTVRVSWTVHEYDTISLHVADTGTGIGDDALARVFDPFFTTKPPGRGTGLGLAMVDAIVRRAGGHVTIDTLVGTGTTVHVHLPRSVEDPGPDAASDRGGTSEMPSTFSPNPPRQATVLLVDDEADVRRVTCRMLQRAGFAVLEADGGTAAVAIGQDLGVAIDVLVTDVMMPGISGRDVIELFRKRRPETPIVCITGFAPAGAEGQSLAGLVHRVVEKPFTSALLTEAVASALASAGGLST